MKNIPRHKDRQPVEGSSISTGAQHPQLLVRNIHEIPSKLICRIYLLVWLLAATIFLPLPYSPVAFFLFLPVLLHLLRPLKPGVEIVVIMLVISLLPVMLASLLNYATQAVLPMLTLAEWIAVISIIPTLYLLDNGLKQNARHLKYTESHKKRLLTPVAKALLFSVLAILLISFIMGNRVVLATGIILLLYLTATLIRAYRAVPGLPLDYTSRQKRIIAGTTTETSFTAVSKAKTSLYCWLTPDDPWIKLRPDSFKLNEDRIELNLKVTPPLAGPTLPKIQASVMDGRGFLQVRQVMEPVELNVIPRARYAAWLATRYLEQAGNRANTSLMPALQKAKTPLNGIDYYDSRTYQQGDRLRDIDWKHSLKLSRLIVKEHTGAAQQAAIIALNLSVKDTEEADKLAYNLISTALTLARETIPAALAAYNRERVMLTTRVLDPREILKQTLLLVKDIHTAEFAQRYLQPPVIGRLQRNINQLKQATSPPARRLLSILDFEYRSMREAANNNPATLALLKVTEHIPPPSLIILVTQSNHDTEALLLTAQKLSRRGFTMLPAAPDRF